ncbi:hypothetical protein [Flavobacterium sp.]|uniref:hypothetical protein n=1 Tax=Flavobacterium sp. TaxID=239 RepID=UPI00374FFF29
MRIFLTCLILSITLISCKNKKSSDKATETIKPITFDVVLNMNVKQDDSFQLYYTDDTSPTFNDKKSVRVTVKGKNEDQKIVFSLPVDDLPTNLRLDLGENKLQPEMKLNTFTINYADKSFSLNGLEILQYFVPGQIDVNKEQPLLKTNQGKSEVYDPMFYPQDNLKTEILKIIK